MILHLYCVVSADLAVLLFVCLLLIYPFYHSIYIDSPPRRSPGRNEFKLEGVVLDWSPVSNGVEPHRLADDAFGHPVLQVSLAATCLVDPRQVPEEPCWLASSCKWKEASQSLGFSANIEVLPSTQLLRAV